MRRKIKPLLDIDSAATFSAKIENEGDMLYAVQNWDFKEFRDKKFNSLRKALVKTAQDLIDYCAFERLEEADAEVTDEKCHHCGDMLDESGDCVTCENHNGGF